MAIPLRAAHRLAYPQNLSLGVLQLRPAYSEFNVWRFGLPNATPHFFLMLYSLLRLDVITKMYTNSFYSIGSYLIGSRFTLGDGGSTVDKFTSPCLTYTVSVMPFLRTT